MRRSLTRFVLIAFLCTLPLQAYARACEMHCALMKIGMANLEAPPSSDTPPCAQIALCDLATSAFVLPPTLSAAEYAASSIPAGAVDPVPDRTTSPPDRPPIFS